MVIVSYETLEQTSLVFCIYRAENVFCYRILYYFILRYPCAPVATCLAAVETIPAKVLDDFFELVNILFWNLVAVNLFNSIFLDNISFVITDNVAVDNLFVDHLSYFLSEHAEVPVVLRIHAVAESLSCLHVNARSVYLSQFAHTVSVTANLDSDLQ